MSLFWFSYLTLWILVVVLSISVLSIIKRQRPPRRNVIPFSHLGLPKGTTFPVDDLVTVQNERIDIKRKGDEKGSLMVYVSTACPVCSRVFPLLPIVTKKEPEIQIIILMEGEVNDIFTKIKEHNLEYPVIQSNPEMLLDMDVSMTPFAYYLSNDGEVLHKGGITGQIHDLFSMLK